MPSTLHRFLLAALLTVTAGITQAATLASFNFDSSHDYPAGPAAVVPDFLIVKFGYSEALDGLTDLGTLVFDGFELDAASAGQTFTLLSAADDAQLPAFIARATNGSLDDARFDVIGNTTGGLGLVSRENFFFGYAPGLGTPDLQGATITGLALFISAIEINPTGTAGGHAWSIAGQFRVIGEPPSVVPLPAAVWLLGGGMVVLGRLVGKSRSLPYRA
ncbi:MAG: hypothetical protein AB7R40_24635 [Nitrospiraceae bacterium]